MTTVYTETDSPLGPILVAAQEAGLVTISFLDGTNPTKPGDDWRREATPLLHDAAEQIRGYFAGALTRFELPLAPRGTAFQQRVWAALGEIPYGTAISYGELARRIGRPTASRAVGAANGQNPLPIVVPCHRVVGHDGRLTGYAGGLHIKAHLLSLEGVGAPQQQRLAL